MRGEPHSYQAIAAGMKEEPDVEYLDGIECRQCEEPAIDQERYDDWMCVQHFRDAVLWDEADRLNEQVWEG